MRIFKKLSKKAIAFVMATALLLGINVCPVSAATVDNPGISPQTVITPWSDYCVVSASTVSTSGIGIRANESIRLDLNIMECRNDYADLAMTVSLCKSSDHSVVQTLRYNSTGNYTFTFTPSQGGSYYIMFGSRAGSYYKFYYTVTF